eukprot:COSAG06_NODE_49937_length_322_cov_0.663677_2_plen_35_part_01
MQQFLSTRWALGREEHRMSEFALREGSERGDLEMV